MSYNRRQLQKDKKALTKAKGPTKSKDTIYNPFDILDYLPQYPQMKKGGTNKVSVKESSMEGAGKGLFSNTSLKRNELIGLAHKNGQPVGNIGKMHNHSNNPNMYSVKVGNERYVYAKRDIAPGEELTTDYRLQPELEQPEDFMKRGGSTRGLVQMPKPSKKGLASKAYSRSLEATNKLFTENRLFEKPKDRKRKVFDPNAKYYQDGGESGCPEGYAFNPKTGECIEWNPTIYNSEDNPTSFDPIGDVIYMNPNDRPEGMSDEEYKQMYQDQLEHEQLHRLQLKNDELRGQSKTPLRMPSTVDNQNYEGEHYYDRRGEEEGYLHDIWNQRHKDLEKFIPYDVVYNNEIDPVMYQLPWTTEGEARNYEHATHEGMPSLFPKQQNGGDTMPTIEDAGSYNEEGFWIPDWSTMTEAARKLNAKTVRTKHGNIIYFDDNWNVKSVDDNPGAMKDGGEYGMPLGAGVSQNFIGNRDNFNVGGIPNLPLRDNRVNYNAFVNGFEPMTKKQKGGVNKTKLTPEEEEAFQNFYSTLPENLKTDDDTYDIRGYWDSEGRPEEFDYSQPKEKDGYYHAYSINSNTGEYLKSPAHDTFQHAVDEDRKIGYRPLTNVYGRNIATENESIADPEEQSFLRNTEGPVDYIDAELTDDEIQAYKDGGYIVEDISIPSLNQFPDGGTYTYSGRTDSKYKKDSRGNWLISNKSTGNQFVPIKDPTGKRTKELDRAAVPEQSYDIVKAPAESTDTQFIKKQLKQVGENRLQDYLNAAEYEKEVVNNEINNLKSKDFLTPDERRKGLTNKSKVSKERRNKAIQDLKWDATINLHDTYKVIKKYNEEIKKHGTVKQLPKDYDFSTSASTYDILTNPLDAFKYSVSTGDVSNMPANYNDFIRAGIEPLEHRGGNLMGNEINVFNPVDIADKVYYHTKEGDYVMAGLNALRALPYTKGLSKVPAIARFLGKANKYVVDPIERGLKYAPFEKVTRNASPLLSTIGKKATVGNALRARAMVHAAQKSPELFDAVGNVIKKKDAESLKNAANIGIDVGYNFFPSASGANPYFLSRAAFNVAQPKQEELIHTKNPLLGGSAFDYLSLIRSLPTIKAKGGETKYVDTELTDAEIQDLIDEGYIVEQL